MKTPNILIIGNSESGKSTAARILAQYFSTGWTGTSEIIVDALMRRWADAHVYQQQLNDLTRLKFHKQFGDLFRIFLRDVGNRLRENDPAALAKACLER
ncbi:MAG: hypothetical protein GY807_24895, partial [Gammaproteobacteria bacterium]|nr:hypothetical protein [Gammaproteobacteria bacterium]